MLASELYSKLIKLNPGLWVDTDRRICHYHKDFPWCGLYYGDKHVMGIPQNYIPEYSILGVDGNDLIERQLIYGDWNGNTGQWFDYDTIAEIEKNYPDLNTRILSRGYRAILATLCRDGYIDKAKAERLFNISIEPQRQRFPARYIDLGY